MQYVGVACSVGMAVQLPLILRSLADSLAFVPASDLPIKIDKDFLSWMGSIPYAHIPEHAMNWWASKAARKLPGHYLQESTLELCLETYRRTHADVRIRITLTPPAQPLPAARCAICRELRVLYIQATESLISLRNTCAANSDNLIAYGEMGRRRMAAAYELAELAQMKETLVPKTNMSTVAVASSASVDIAASTVQAAPAQRQRDDTAPISHLAPPTAHSAAVPAPMSANPAMPSPPCGTAVATFAPPAAMAAAMPAPPAVRNVANPLPPAANSTVVLAPPAADVVLNTESQWTFGVSLTEDEIIKRLGAASRRGRTWNMRSGQWHSGYFWALPEGKINESGCSTVASVAPPHASDFSQTSKTAEQEPPPTSYSVPDKFLSKHFRHTPPATIQNAADGSNPAGPPQAVPTGLFNMFGQRAAGTSATVKPSRSVEMAAPALSVPVTVAEQNAQVPAATAEKPEAATAMFQMFGPPTVAHVDRATSSAPAAANALQPAARASANVSTLAPPAAQALLSMFGTSDTRAANALAVSAAAPNDPQPVSGAQPTSADPQARVPFNMFGSAAAPPETISASAAGDEQVLPAVQTAVVPRGAPLFNMFTSSAVSPPAVADFVPRADQGAQGDVISAAPQRPALFHMFAPSDGQAAAARPPLTNAAVSNDAHRPAALPTRPFFNMFGSSNAQPTPVPSALPVFNRPALPVSVGANATIQTKNAEQASPPPVLYGPPALGVVDIFGTRAGTAAPATQRSLLLPHLVPHMPLHRSGFHSSKCLTKVMRRFAPPLHRSLGRRCLICMAPIFAHPHLYHRRHNWKQ